ncbi:chemotaxis protein CheW [Halothiobacillus diazotrophicus]|uniref:Chemotaxis protein CheW n=1 Tax=Halothiobacillus diazotrophicus TaxID=1860122 RepID=A0A191ZEP0_9GAMM|nr:chemotaxis protein CheW [Halothiobacillus diazotrophicus]ANJ66338.1 chemotaxis protein CheW [Halothiobacillus diazotrophicus]
MGALTTTGAASAKTLVVSTGDRPETQQYLTFMLSGEVYAIGILAVREIIEFGQLTEVPNMPDFIRGVINLRGAVVPVVDLSVRFGKGETAVSRRTCIVINEIENDGETQTIGVMVDAVNEVLEIPASEIEMPPTFGAKIRSDFIEGMGKVEGKFVILLNVDRVLSVDEMSELVAARSQR